MSDSVKLAIDKYLKKNDKNYKQSSRKNKKPELEILKKLKSWLESQGAYVFRVESQAVYSKSAGMYLYGQTDKGVSDLLGFLNTGHGLAVEVKNLGRRSTLRPEQRKFLFEAISRNQFACVSDSVEHLSKIFSAWLNSTCPMVRKQLLLNDLPKPKLGVDSDKPLFED